MPMKRTRWVQNTKANQARKDRLDLRIIKKDLVDFSLASLGELGEILCGLEEIAKTCPSFPGSEGFTITNEHMK